MSTRVSSSPANDSEIVDYERMLAAMDATAKAITGGYAMRDLVARARMEGISADPPRSRAYINDQIAADEAARAVGSRRRGLTIVMHGPPHDPMQRPGTEPVFRGVKQQWKGSSAASPALPPGSARTPAPTSVSPTAKVPEPPLRTKDGEVLEMVQDEPTPCPHCRGKGIVLDPDDRTYRACRACDGHGVVPPPE